MEGAAIGNGGSDTQKGAELGMDQVASGLTVDGFIQTYNPGDNMDTATPEKSTIGTTGDHSWDKGTVTTQPTCTTPGVKTFTCKNPAHGTKTEPIPALDHDFKTYIYDNNATCEADGTETAKCERCDEKITRTKTGSKLTHLFSNYTYNGDATCTKDGTETAKCEHGCGETDTRTKAGSKLTHLFSNYTYNNDATCTQDGTETAKCEHGCGETASRVKVGSKLGHLFESYVYNKDATYEADGTETAVCTHPGCTVTNTRTAQGTKLEPLPRTQKEAYWVCGADGQALPYQSQVKDGVLTVTVQAHTASLRGSTESLRQLEAQGITEIRFITNKAQSDFALSDILTSGTGSVTLTHEGETVTFTLADKDISGILK